MTHFIAVLQSMQPPFNDAAMIMNPFSLKSRSGEFHAIMRLSQTDFFNGISKYPSLHVALASSGAFEAEPENSQECPTIAHHPIHICFLVTAGRFHRIY
jgi:hypothetical protein